VSTDRGDAYEPEADFDRAMRELDALDAAEHARKAKAPDAPLRLVRSEEGSTLYERTQRQALDADEDLDRDYSRCPRLPWDSLHSVIGHGFLPAQFWALAASSGHGKSTVVMNVVMSLAKAGQRVYMLPLEQPAKTMRLYWAALDCGYPTRLVLKNDWGHLPSGAKSDIRDHLGWQRRAGADLVYFSDEPYVNEQKLGAAMLEAKHFDADLLVIDHVHHLRLQGHDRYGAWENMCQALSELPKLYGIPILGAAQLNRGMGPIDKLKAFMPPHVDQIQGGKVLEQNAHVVMACYRPLADHMTADDAKAVRNGASVKPFLQENTIGFHVLKTRIEGTIGDVVKLEYRAGRIICAETESRLAYEARHSL
jgi:replicative DNA helicase